MIGSATTKTCGISPDSLLVNLILIDLSLCAQTKSRAFQQGVCYKEFDGWFDSKYHPSVNEGKLKGIAAVVILSHTSNERMNMQSRSQAKPKEKSFDLSTLDQDFESTFKSKRKLATLTQLVELTGRTIEDMRLAMVDTSFEIDELEYWAEKYLVIENKPNRDFDLNFISSFTETICALLIHEFYVFEGSDITYYKCKPTEDDNSVIKAYDSKNFFKVQIQYTENKKPRSTKLTDLLNTIPFHKFANTTFSLANPLLAKDLHEEITESDLHPVLVDYLKRIICFNDSERYQWLMEYIGSICHYPDSKTKKQIGKSNFFKLLTSLLGTANTHMTQHLTNVFGERGSPQLRHNKLCWFE
ncbi:hypothetical protein GQ600_12201 [Phytophthora cactorum]|nr:hypothetical protein GQ600_12201 [Phytophthora cactorum]